MKFDINKLLEQLGGSMPFTIPIPLLHHNLITRYKSESFQTGLTQTNPDEIFRSFSEYVVGVVYECFPDIEKSIRHVDVHQNIEIVNKIQSLDWLKEQITNIPGGEFDSIWEEQLLLPLIDKLPGNLINHEEKKVIEWYCKQYLFLRDDRAKRFFKNNKHRLKFFSQVLSSELVPKKYHNKIHSNLLFKLYCEDLSYNISYYDYEYLINAYYYELYKSRHISEDIIRNILLAAVLNSAHSRFKNIRKLHIKPFLEFFKEIYKDLNFVEEGQYSTPEEYLQSKHKNVIQKKGRLFTTLKDNKPELTISSLLNNFNKLATTSIHHIREREDLLRYTIRPDC